MNHEINLTGNLSQKALDGAKSIDVLTAALKAEQKALTASQQAFARQSAGGKVDIGLASKVREGASRIDVLRRQIASARAEGQRPTKLGLVEAIEKSGGPIGGLIRNLRAAWDAMKANPTAALVVGLGAVSVAAVALGSKLIGLARDAITLGVGLADSARSARLLNEAADIAAGTHKQLGGIIEDVRRRSDVGRDVLAGYGRELRILGFDSRQTQLVLGAMAVAESALGSSAAAGVKGIAEQSRAFRRLTLGVRDAYGEYASLRAIGLQKADLFAELSRSSGKSIASVRTAVGAGRVSVRDGMAAIEAALRRKFGGTVQAQSLSITSQFRRMREDFAGLFSGADIEPLLKGLRSISEIFSQDTASGRAFKAIVSGLMTDLGKAAEQLGPTIKEALLGLSAEAAKPGGLATTIRGWINDAKELGSAISSIAEAIKTIGSAASAVGTAIKVITSPIKTAREHAKAKEDAAFKRAFEGTDTAQDATESGRLLMAGAANGVAQGAPLLSEALRKAAKDGQAAFRAENKIQSPSKAYERDAAYIPQGAAQGVKKATPLAVRAVISMSDSMRGGFAVPSLAGLSIPAPHVEVRIIANDPAVEAFIARVARVEVVSVLKHAADRGPQPRAT